MIFPSRDEFSTLIESGKIIPVVKEIPVENNTPTSVYEKLGGPRENSFILESGKGAENISRYSFVGGDPFLIFKSIGTNIEMKKDGKSEFYTGDPLEFIKDIFESYQAEPNPKLPKFFGGAVGYFTYDMVRHFEKIPSTAVDELNIPEAYMLFIDKVIIFDHFENIIKIVVNVNSNRDSSSYDEAVAKIRELEEKINSPEIAYQKSLETKRLKKKEIRANFSEEEFAEIVRQGKNYIEEGDIFQVNLSVRLYQKLQVPPYLVYKTLRDINPSPYSGFMKLDDDIELVSCSPELLVKVQGDLVETRPIAGTRKRGIDEEEDKALINELLTDKKENAEHIMLVDLERNDLGRVCDYGTVEVNELMVTEEYSHVIHIVSNVKGRLHKEKDRFDAIRATFPGGTITGAPKVRCMEIIEELEGIRRGVYTGSMGWLNFAGDMELNIAIRTILVKGGTAYIQAGAGIVADSDPYKEYHESLKKAEAMLKAIEQAEEVFSNDFND